VIAKDKGGSLMARPRKTRQTGNGTAEGVETSLWAGHHKMADR